MDRDSRICEKICLTLCNIRTQPKTSNYTKIFQYFKKTLINIYSNNYTKKLKVRPLRDTH